jgi:hypothetical protein
VGGGNRDVRRSASGDVGEMRRQQPPPPQERGRDNRGQNQGGVPTNTWVFRSSDDERRK